MIVRVEVTDETSLIRTVDSGVRMQATYSYMHMNNIRIYEYLPSLSTANVHL